MQMTKLLSAPRLLDIPPVCSNNGVEEKGFQNEKIINYLFQ